MQTPALRRLGSVDEWLADTVVVAMNYVYYPRNSPIFVTFGTLRDRVGRFVIDPLLGQEPRHLALAPGQQGPVQIRAARHRGRARLGQDLPARLAGNQGRQPLAEIGCGRRTGAG